MQWRSLTNGNRQTLPQYGCDHLVVVVIVYYITNTLVVVVNSNSIYKISSKRTSQNDLNNCCCCCFIVFKCADVERGALHSDTPARPPGGTQLSTHAYLHDVQRLAVPICRRRGRSRILHLWMATGGTRCLRP